MEPPEERIRRHLDRDGARAVSVRALARAWSIEQPSEDDLRRIEDALARVRVAVVPGLAGPVELDREVELRPHGKPLDRPELRIRRHVESAGAATASAGRLIGSFGVESPGPRDRVRIARRLTRAGVAVEPALQAVDDLDAEVVLSAARRPAPPGRARVLVVGGSAVVLLSLFLPWFRALRAGVEPTGAPTSGWEWLGTLDVMLAIVAALGAVFAVAVGRAPERAREAGFALAVAGAIGGVGVISRIASPPDVTAFAIEASRRIGPYVALIGLAALLAGAIVALSTARPPSRRTTRSATSRAAS